ncbi:uncharacterized protein si:cabz01007807.1 isoform X2 [Anabas testudineus]|uniref:uncharacterized protein si:cabz01007807.1 isoform X2 n=1 Tax=Anabas testudineus TaxID=64144 RepID=UPI000E464518|nr:uncharacterized protein si:cabz01007807.1 isoform X2 [Anabas testudineus]
MMRADTEQSVGREDCGGRDPTSASVERRPSIVALQNMLKKVSQSPFQNQYKTLVSSPSDSSASSGNDSQNKQNGVNGDSATMNPFYKYYMESGTKSHAAINVERETSQDINHDTILLPPPEFQSSPLDLQPPIKTVENGDKLSEPQKDPFQTLTHSLNGDLFQTSSLDQNTSRGYFHDVTLNSPDLFKAAPAQPQNLSNTLQSNNDLFQPSKGEECFHAGRSKEVNVFDKSPSIYVDPFRSPSNKEDDVFLSPQPTVANLFLTATASEDLFQAVSNKGGELSHFKEKKQDLPSNEKNHVAMSSVENLDIFSTSSTSAIDPFPSPFRGDLFQDLSSLDDPFGTTPSKQNDPFQDISKGAFDIFQPLPSTTNGNNIFAITAKNTASKTTYSTLSLTSPSEMKMDAQPSPDVLKLTPAESRAATQTESLNGLNNIILTSPEGTKYDVLQPTPFTRARNRAMSTKHSPTEMSHVPTIRRPPKPLPRTRPPRTEEPTTLEKPLMLEKPPTPEKPPPPEKPPKPEKPPALDKPIEPEATAPKRSPKQIFRRLPKPVLSLKPKTQESKLVEPDDYVVFEDILLLGQERCVEDWPEDSPELNPGFKPPGKFKLRRESLIVKSDYDGGSGEDQDGSRSQSKKKDKKFRMSLSSRKSPKDNTTNEKKSRTLSLSHKSSKEYFSEPHVSAEDDGEQEGLDYKKKRQSTKVGSLLRRSSSPFSTSEGKYANGHLPQESKSTMLDNTSGEEEEGEVTHKEKRKKKMKIKFVPQRGFAITVQKPGDELKGAHGYTPRKSSKEDMWDDNSRKKNSFSAEELDDELNPMDDCKPKTPKHRSPFPILGKSKKSYDITGESEQIRFSHHVPQQACKDDFDEDEVTGKDFLGPGELNDSEQDELEDCKPKKSLKVKGFKKNKAKNKAMYLDYEDPPGAASIDYLSEAAKAEWLAAQRDQSAAGLDDDDEDGDTDSLMEWWYTVEQWDELPSDEEDKIMKEDECKSFTILADKVQRGLRLFNKVFTERAEVLWQSIITLNTMADDISDFHHKARIAGITGGTTTAVGGVTAIAGLALAPFTFGASLVVTAVGVGVAAAGGITSASAAISDNVNNMHDRKRVETVLQEYEDHLLAIGKILHFVNQGLYKLRGHPFLRSGTQHYSEDWEIRRAVQMISLVDSPVMRATEVTDTALSSVQGLFKGTDKYFIKDSGELKKGCKKEMVALIKEVANVLNAAVVDLNSIREELQDATGGL